MGRLTKKELLENRLYIALGLLVVSATSLLDSLGIFWVFPATDDCWVFLVCVIAFIMGLGAYSRELARDTLGFTFSRPIRWWWVYLSKILAALIVFAALSAISGGIYAAACPAKYRPFLDARFMGQGALGIGIWMALVYFAGFLCSCVLPGIAFSLVLSFGVLLAAVLYATLAADWFWIWPLLFGIIPASALAANVLVARAPTVLDRSQRIGLWLKIVAAGFVIAFLSSKALDIANVQSKRSYPSPDLRVTAYRYTKMDKILTTEQGKTTSDAPPDRLLIREGKHRFLVDSAPSISVVAWSPDSRTLLYRKETRGLNLAWSATASNGWRPSLVGPFPNGVSEPGYFNLKAWSPSARRFAFSHEAWSGSKPEPRRIIVVVDPVGRRCKTVWRGNPRDFWWIDDDRIAVMDYEQEIKVVSMSPNHFTP